MSPNINQQELLTTIKLQQQASNPKNSVFVAASAGSGKTKILTDRVLRLLLNDIRPNQILCLTFTKVAAFEMKNRIYKELSEWSIITESQLQDRIFNLTAQNCSKSLLKKARSLFVRVLDDSEGLKINTIHAFCQTLMAKFPIESNIKPNFSIIDSQKENKLLLQAKDMLLKEALENKNLRKKIENIAVNLNEDDFLDVILELINQRSALESTIKKYHDLNNLNKQILLIFNSKDKDEDYIDDLIQKPDLTKNFNKEALLKIANLAKESDKKSDQNYYNLVTNYLQNPNKDNFDNYLSIFLTKDKSIKKTIITSAIIKKDLNIKNDLLKEAKRLQNICEEINAFTIANLSIDLLNITNKMLEFYQNLKNSNNYLDYNDLISKGSELLNNKEISQWVKYKLDGAISHILVDESQDTNHNQWQIIKAISDDFFDKNDEIGEERTIFIVGDEKQSIYSFQGADPSIFNDVFYYYSQKLEQNNSKMHNISLNNSFRSKKNILQLVDNIFKEQDYKKAISKINIVKHNPIKLDNMGKVELWPIINVKEDDANSNKDDFSWKINVKPVEKLNSKELLAKLIAKKIKNWLESEKIIYSENRIIEPKDIMILIKDRANNLGNLIINNLQKEKIPVSGGDKFELSSHFLVKDLLLIAKFLLLPQDDLNLATLLKSPIIAISEEELFDVCQIKDRESIYLFQALKLSDNINIKKSLIFLDDVQKYYLENQNQIYQLFLYILEYKNKKVEIIEYFKEESREIIHQFLNLCLNFENSEDFGLENFVIQLQNSSLKINIGSANSELNQVKISTIHSAKGLESKIIILADSFHNSQKIYGTNSSRILWFKHNDIKIPIYKSDKNCALTDGIKNADKNLSKEEYLRLLYVSLTRAEDELYIAGFGNKSDQNCWYNIIKNYGLQNAKSKDSDFSKILGIKSDEFTEDDKILYFTDENKNILNKNTENSSNDNKKYKIPEFLTKKAEIELFKNISYPSTIDKNQTISNDVNIVNDFGNIIHKILELFIKKLRNNDASQKINTHLDNFYPKIDSKIRLELFRQISAISNNKVLDFIYCNKIETEIAVFYEENNDIISGKIDLLVIKDNEIIIIDYKSNKIIEKEIDKTANKYKKQLNIYRKIISNIYPDKIIKTAIIWTYLSETKSCLKYI
ncbi:double-strand break repair helicase AddA [Rickettsiales bacterium]|nr:double-strand break repair helicase AddA [Rickettsiales bacterium]